MFNQDRHLKRGSEPCEHIRLPDVAEYNVADPSKHCEVIRACSACRPTWQRAGAGVELQVRTAVNEASASAYIWPAAVASVRSRPWIRWERLIFLSCITATST